MELKEGSDVWAPSKAWEDDPRYHDPANPSWYQGKIISMISKCKAEVRFEGDDVSLPVMTSVLCKWAKEHEVRQFPQHLCVLYHSLLTRIMFLARAGGGRWCEDCENPKIKTQGERGCKCARQKFPTLLSHSQTVH